tara:strand:- start:141 stop:683 length:543 start_codon:yes stop_codon:yes gene_type:complete
VALRKSSRLKKKQNSQGLYLNAAIGVIGTILLGFIFSFSSNVTHKGVPIDVTFPEIKDQPMLAIEVYEKNPIQDIKVEVLNGCGIKGIAAKTADYLRSNRVDVIRSDNADNHNYPNTVIISRNENIESLKAVTQSFGLSLKDDKHVFIVPDESLGVDITVILGKDINDFPLLADLIQTIQ